jgi:hypothetical protein
VDADVVAVVVGSDGNSGLDDFTFSKPSKTLTGITMRSVGEITGGSSGQGFYCGPFGNYRSDTVTTVRVCK